MSMYFVNFSNDFQPQRSVLLAWSPHLFTKGIEASAEAACMTYTMKKHENVHHVQGHGIIQEDRE